ncbi:MAG: relaxase/mobilization nuclease domain-containing protein [Pseudomonadota bacterium]
MILQGSTRTGGRNLVDHMLNEVDNDHVELFEISGVASSDMLGAVREIEAIAKGTKCQKAFYSLSLNPPLEADASEREFLDAVKRAERALGFEGQPRIILFHEKEGRRHCHVIWSRIDERTMTTISNSNDRYKLNTLSRELYIEHGWNLPEGLCDRDRKSEHMKQADHAIEKRSDIALKDHAALIRDAYETSDTRDAFAAALEERGYILAQGRRGLVAVDTETRDIHAVSRRLNLKTRDVSLRFGDGRGLPSVEEAKALAEKRQAAVKDAAAERTRREEKALQQLRALKAQQRKERHDLLVRQQYERDERERSFVKTLFHDFRQFWKLTAAHLARLRDHWMGKDHDDAHAERIAMLRQTQEQKFADERDALRRTQLEQRRHQQRELSAERFVNRQKALQERKPANDRETKIARQREIADKLRRDREQAKRLER